MSNEVPAPLCSSCKFGLCVRQVMPMDGNIINEREKEPWEQEEEEQKRSIVPSIIAYSALCWWAPEDRRLRYPNEMMYVKSCSRYERRTDKDDDPVSEEE